MTLKGAANAVHQEYNAEVSRFREDAELDDQATETIVRDFDELMGSDPVRILAAMDFESQADLVVLCIRLGMRIQRKLDNPELITRTHSGPAHRRAGE